MSEAVWRAVSLNGNLEWTRCNGVHLSTDCEGCGIVSVGNGWFLIRAIIRGEDPENSAGTLTAADAQWARSC